MNGIIAKVVLAGATYSFDKPYDYIIPPSISGALPGCRVVIPFGRADLKRQGMILSVYTGELSGKLKEIISLTDNEPVLNDEMLKLCCWIKERLFCTHFDVINAMLPTGLNYKLTEFCFANKEFSSAGLLTDTEKEVFEYLLSKDESISSEKIQKAFSLPDGALKALAEKGAILLESTPVRRMGDATDRWIKLKCEPEQLPDFKLTKRQKEVARLISDTGSISLKELRYFTGASLSVINNLIDREVAESFEKQVFRTPYLSKIVNDREEIQLTDEQEEAYRGLYLKYKEDSGVTSLIYGVTGSGKTQVFLKLVDGVINSGRGVIVMVPEIALTPQLMDIFSNRYGNKIAVFHSAMSLGQRMDEWKRVKNGDASIAIGTRSAVFAPVNNLGLIIIDEEQEHTYKSEKSPRFHAREVAKYRIAYNKGLLCLASATPSIESFSAAKSGKYSMFTLKKRYGNSILPEVITVDMRKEILSGNSSSISRELNDNIVKTLENKNQAIILLNRRGHNTYISCPSCGNVASCPNCSISLTYHSANNRLMCHYCGYSAAAEKKCPDCGNEHLRFMGIGTQKVADELRLLYPNARVLRVDADSTMSRESFSSYMTAFSNKEYDIMLGTQMVAKGLNFPNVTLVGVIGADQAAFSEDFRSFERSFSLLTQVVGRAGRGENSGIAVIQTVNPESNVIALAKAQDYDAFYNDEILTRKLMIYPPFCDICQVAVTSCERAIAQDTINEVFYNIKNMIDREYSNVKIIILGPAAASMPKLNNKYRFRMIIKCKNSKTFREMLNKAIEVKLLADAGIYIDMNPETII